MSGPLSRTGAGRLLLSAVLAFLAAGCRQMNPEPEPPLKPPAAFSRQGEVALPDRWWRSFGSEELDALVRSGLEDNFPLQSAWQRLRAAEALLDRERASLLPTLDAEGTGRVQRPEAGNGDSFELGLRAGYEVDLWGRIRASVAAEAFRFEAGREDYAATALALSGELVATAFAVVVARQQLELLEDQVGVNSQVLELLRNRFGSGQIPRVDLLRQEQLLEETRGARSDARARLGILENRLLTLLGRPAGDSLPVLTAGLPDLPPLPRTGTPGELLQRRPDVRVAYRQLQAADRDLAVAVSNRWPRLTLSASIFSEDNDTVSLFDDWIRTLAGSLVMPVIDGGSRRAEIRRTDALRTSRLYAYGQTVLDAIREVEDALEREHRQRERLESIARQVRLAGEAYQQLRREYLNGVVDYLDVLTALTDEQRLRREQLSARLALYEFRVSLYRALAGAIPERVPETNSEPNNP
jgi:NodT family efflux transporter outer membrane factor (OMF) lipoprotein